MTIRPIQPRDREPLLRLVADVFADDEIEVASELVIAAVVSSRDYRILLADEIAATPAGIGGYVCYGPTPMTASTYDLYWIGCHPDARGRGLARALVEAMEADLRARGGSAVRVETEDSSGYAAARSLYERLGYPIAAHLPHFYRPGDGLIIYYKPLSSE